MKRLIAATCLGLSLSSAAYAAKGPVIVVMSGFSTCSRDADGSFSPWSNSITNRRGVALINKVSAEAKSSDEQPRWLASCYDPFGVIHYQTSYGSTIQWASGGDSQPFREFLQDASDDFARQVIIIGHSHGGWMASRVIAEMGLIMSNTMLITIDPISYMDCGVGNYARAIAAAASWNPWALTELEPCQRAPADIDLHTRRNINQNIGRDNWFHYYQENFWPLHSGAFPAGSSTPGHSSNLGPFYSVMEGGVSASWNAHWAIQNYNGIWHMLETRLTMQRDDETSF
jgi:hypothetical protein